MEIYLNNKDRAEIELIKVYREINKKIFRRIILIIINLCHFFAKISKVS
jgi:hypothetical protein